MLPDAISDTLKIKDSIETAILNRVENIFDFSYLDFRQSSNLKHIELVTAEKYDNIALINFSPPLYLQTISVDIGDFTHAETIHISEEVFQTM